jgi:hypothetical protein
MVGKCIDIARYTFEDKYVKRDTYILPEFVSPTNPNGECIFSVMIETKKSSHDSKHVMPNICIDNGDGLNMEERILDVGHTDTEDMSLFHIVVILTHEEKMNIKFQKDVYIKFFFLGELYTP